MRISDWSSDVCSSDLAQHFALHVVDDAVHAGDGVGRAGELLAVEPERHLAQRVEPLADQLQLDQQAEAAAGVVVGFLAGARAQDLGHQEADLARGEELAGALALARSEEHTSELQSLLRISYAVFCLKKKNTKKISI